MKKKPITTEVKLKRMKRKFTVALLLLILLAISQGLFIYFNFDYLVFKHMISRHYIYTDALRDLYNKEIKTDVGERYSSYFDNLVISIVSRHIREEAGDRYTYQYIPESYKLLKDETKDTALMSEIKIIDNKTAYMRLTNFSVYSRDFLYDQVEKIEKYPFFILDLRNNYGGDIDAMAEIADAFLSKGSIIAVDKMRMLNWTYKAKKGKLLTFQKIVILQNGNTASASENLIAALKENLDNVTLIGGTTFGKGIGQYTIPLRRGFAFKATILRWYTPNGSNIQHTGIEPDIPYEGEDITDIALEQLK